MDFSNLKGIVFDLDGTLINSSIDFPGMKRSIIPILEEHYVPSGLLKPTQTTVVLLEKAEEIWEKKVTPIEERRRVVERIEEIMNQWELKAVSTVKEVCGAGITVRKLKDMGYGLSVLTRGHHKYAVEALKKLNMLEFFDPVLGRNETPRPKPYPEALQHTAGLMRLGLDEIVFVGDHPIDADCANNANVLFIGVLSGLTNEKVWSDYGLEILLNSVKDIPSYLAGHSQAND